MKNLFKIILLISFLSSFTYAPTPFSLEGIKAVNVVVLNKGKLVSKDMVKLIKKDTIEALNDEGIKTKTDEFSNFIIKIEANKVNQKIVVNVSLILVENVNPVRDTKLTNIAITYQKSDFFITDDIDAEVYESAVEFLLQTFIDQFIDEK